MAGSLVAEIAVFWPLLLAGVLVIGGLALVLVAVAVEDFVQNYGEIGAPQWLWSRRAHQR